MSTKVFSLIKSGNTLHIAPGQRFVKAEILSDLLTVEEAMERIEQDAAEYRKEQVKEIELAKEQAQKEGFEAGFQAWAEKTVELEEEIIRVDNRLNQQLAPIVLQAARKIVGNELEINPKAIVSIVKNALQNVAQHRQILIYVNPEELDAIFEEREGLREVFEHLESLTIRGRDDISKGSCIIETEAGIINAQLDNQWKILEQVFERLMAPAEEEV